MSYSMSPPPQKPPQQPYSPYQNSGPSPPNPSPYGPPPAKRQRTSPDPRSPPNGMPAWGPPHALPNAGPYGNPYAPARSAVQSPYATTPTYSQSPQQSSFNTPQPYPYQQSPWQSQTSTPVPQARPGRPPAQSSRDMPPPPPPNKDDREEKVGVDDIGDSLFGSGINLKDEENYMHSIYNNRHNQYNPHESQSFSTNQNTSFGSSTMTPNNSFNLLTQGTSFGSQDAVAGTIGAARTEEQIELEHRKKREIAARDQAERRQHHLNNQFLQCNNVRKRMDILARNQSVMLNMTGCFVRQLDPEPQTSAMVNGAGREGLVAVREEQKRPESVVNQNTAFEQMVSLISLAAGERIRGLMDESYTLARARRYGDHGRVVPTDFADIAEGEGKRNDEDVVMESITGTQWDKVPGQNSSSPKDADMADGVQKSKSSTPQPQHTISFQGKLNAELRSLMQRDRQAEEDRIKKREARKRKASEMANSADTPPADSAAPENASASADSQPKMTKKEQIRQQKEKNSNTEAQLHHSTNQTAAMMALGKKGKRYGWMTGGASAMPTNRFAKPTTSANASGTATPIKAESTSTVVTPGAVGATAMARTGSAQASAVNVPEWGDWRETGKGIELRDWILVLERDGKEKAALVRALHKLED